MACTTMGVGKQQDKPLREAAEAKNKEGKCALSPGIWVQIHAPSQAPVTSGQQGRISALASFSTRQETCLLQKYWVNTG